MAAEQGLIGRRDCYEVCTPWARLSWAPSFYDWAFEAMAEPNPSAAMPSLHFAASFVVVGVGIVLRSRQG